MTINAPHPPMGIITPPSPPLILRGGKAELGGVILRGGESRVKLCLYRDEGEL
jgi:hypothetical protein